MAKAFIKKYNNEPAICIDDKIYPPMTMTVTMADVKLGAKGKIVDSSYYENLGKSGIKIFYVMCNNLDIDENAVDDFKDTLKTIIKAVPDCYIMVRISLVPSLKWMEENPDELVSYTDNRKITTRITSETIEINGPGMPSLCSYKWQKDMGETLLKTIKLIEESEYSEKIAGYFFGAGGTSEWYYINPIEDFDTKAYADTSPAFRKVFENFLTRKYGKGNFEVKIPNTDERFYTGPIDNIIEKPKPAVRPTENPPKPPCNGFNHGSFIDFNKNHDAFDFYRCWDEGTADSIIYFSKLVKENYPDRLTGAFYGSMGGSEFICASNSSNVIKVLDSGYVDFLATPGVYENRQPGGFIGQRQCPDSFRLRNTMFITEDDVRTHLENSYFREYAETFTMDETINILKRDFGKNICMDIQSWWFDQIIGGGRYKAKEIYDLFKKQQEIAEKAYSLNRKKNSEIAFIYDEESTHVISKASTDECVQNMRNYEIACIGAPSDLYYHNDMKNPDMPDYKLYIFENCFYLTDKEREEIKNKLKKNHATALFMYGQGIINPDRENPLDVENVSEFTEINCKEDMEVIRPMFKVIKDNEITKNLDEGKRYGAFIRKRERSFPFIAQGMPNSYVYPVIYPDDENTKVIGEFLTNSKNAVAVKEKDDFTSIYCGSKYITADFIREVARYAGCHIYEEEENVLYANNNFILIHAAKTGKIKIKLDRVASPFELYEEKFYGKNTDEISFYAVKGDTKMFYIE